MNTVSYTVLDQLLHKFAHLLFFTKTNETLPSIIIVWVYLLFQCLVFWLKYLSQDENDSVGRNCFIYEGSINDLWLRWNWWFTFASPVTTHTDNWQKMKNIEEKKQVKINLNSTIILSHFIKKGAHNLFKCNLIQSFIISYERLLNLNWVTVLFLRKVFLFCLF